MPLLDDIPKWRNILTKKNWELWWTSVSIHNDELLLEFRQRVANGLGRAREMQFPHNHWAPERIQLYHTTRTCGFNIFVNFTLSNWRAIFDSDDLIPTNSRCFSPITKWWKLKDRSEAKFSLRHRKDASPRGLVCACNLGRKVLLNTQEATWRYLHFPLVAIRSDLY